MSFEGAQGLEIVKRALEKEDERLKEVKITQEDFDETLKVYTDWFEKEGEYKCGIIKLLSERGGLTSEELSKELHAYQSQIVYCLNNLMSDFLVIDGCVTIDGGLSKVYSLNKEDLEYETKKRKLK